MQRVSMPAMEGNGLNVQLSRSPESLRVTFSTSPSKILRPFAFRKTPKLDMVA